MSWNSCAPIRAWCASFWVDLFLSIILSNIFSDQLPLSLKRLHGSSEVNNVGSLISKTRDSAF